MDLMHDQLEDGFNREALGIEVDFSLPTLRVIRALTQVLAWRDKRQVIRCDNGPEYIRTAIAAWAKLWGIRFEHIEPGKPQQNALRGAIQPNSALRMAVAPPLD